MHVVSIPDVVFLLRVVTPLRKLIAQLLQLVLYEEPYEQKVAVFSENFHHGRCQPAEQQLASFVHPLYPQIVNNLGFAFEGIAELAVDKLTFQLCPGVLQGVVGK